MPQVTIFLPTYNPTPAHLRAAIECVQAQTMQDWELFVHDDPSQADVRAMVEPFLDDRRITFLRSEKRLGIGRNWNACRTLGTGEFVQYLFQDDLWEPTYLEEATKVFTDPTIGFVTVQHHYQFEGAVDPERRGPYEYLTRERLKIFTPGKNDRERFLREWISRGLRPNFIGEPSFVMLRRSFMGRVGPFLEDMPQGLDVEYWVRCLARTDFAFVPASLGTFRVHPGGASMQNDLSGQGLFDRIGYFDALLRELPSGDLKTLTKHALVERFAEMSTKFFGRVKKGGKVGAAGSGVLLRVVLRHPLLVLQGVLRMLRMKLGD